MPPPASPEKRDSGPWLSRLPTPLGRLSEMSIPASQPAARVPLKCTLSRRCEPSWPDELPAIRPVRRSLSGFRPFLGGPTPGGCRRPSDSERFPSSAFQRGAASAFRRGAVHTPPLAPGVPTRPFTEPTSVIHRTTAWFFGDSLSVFRRGSSAPSPCARRRNLRKKARLICSLISKEVIGPRPSRGLLCPRRVRRRVCLEPHNPNPPQRRPLRNTDSDSQRIFPAAHLHVRPLPQ